MFLTISGSSCPFGPFQLNMGFEWLQSVIWFSNWLLMVVYLTYLQQQYLLNLVHWNCDTFVCVFCLFQGLIKIRGDKCWRELTCMDYHYEVQTVFNVLCVFSCSAYQAVTVHKADGLSHSPILHPLNRLIFSSAAELCFLSSWHLEVFSA